MNITYLVSSFPKLSEKFVLDQITGLIDRGHEINIIATGYSDESLVHADFTKYHLNEKTIYLKKTSDFPGFEINAELINCLLNTDLIHAHFATLPSEIALAIAKIADIPFIFTAHAYDIFIDPDIEKLKSISEAADQIITISEYNKNYLLNLLGEKFSDKLSTIHCGINLEELIPSKHKKSNQDLTLLTIGRLIEKKGISIALEAISKVTARNPKLNLKYNIIGGGPLKEIFETQITKLNLTDTVNLLGEQTCQSIQENLIEADIFILPSVTASNGDQEGIPVVLLEAQAMQIPVISTFHTGIPEGVQDNITGYLVPENDVETLVERIEQLLKNPDKRLIMGQAGREWIKKQFNNNDSLDQLELIFQKINSKRSAFYLNNVQESFAALLRNRVMALVSKLEQQKDTTIQANNMLIENQKAELDLARKQLNTLQEFHDQVFNSAPHKLYRSILKPLLNRLKK